MSRGRYVYEDPSIGAIISAVAVVDFVLGERHYESYLKQTTGGPGDLSLAYKNAKVVLIEFKAPELATCNGRKCWRYEIEQVRSSLFYAYLHLANRGLLFLGLIHGLADPDGAPSDGKATFRHAPLTTAFVLPTDTGQCLSTLRQNNITTIHITKRHPLFPFPYLLCDLIFDPICYIDLSDVTYRRDFVRCYLATCWRSSRCCDFGVSKLQTLECGEVKVVDLATLLCCLIRCKFGIKGEEFAPLLRDVASVLQEAPHEISHLYALISTLELIPLRNFTDLLI
ncbi:MAG: hypothetical protein ACPL3C_11055 [Pyrobaculum sp.]